MGAGAIVAALNLPRLRQMMPRDVLVMRSTLLQSVSMAAMAYAPNAWVAVPAMVLNGMAWITCANSLSVSAQLALPDWVRARGMSMYQMAIMGASAAGAALWGQVSTLSSVSTGLLIAAASGTAVMLVAQLPGVRPQHRGRHDTLAPVQGARGRRAARRGQCGGDD
jgi:predicted MFS family arabinose efflux permease